MNNMNNMNNKNGYTLTELIIVMFMVLIICIIGGCGLLLIKGGCHLKKSIDEKGLKGISTQIWEGTNKISNN